MTLPKITYPVAGDPLRSVWKSHAGKTRTGFSRLLEKSLRNPSGPSQAHPGTPLSSPPQRALEWIILGILTEKTPSLFDLLAEHPLFGNESRTILNAAPNTPLASSPIPLGSKVFLNTRTRHLAVQTPGDPPPVLLEDWEKNLPQDPLSDNLARALKPYIGSSYDRLDCYELLIQGLTDMGLHYRGLKEQLVNTAVRDGLSNNAYLTGEGLIDAAGNRIYTQSIGKVRHPDKEADRILSEMAPRLNEGYILSFSTPTRGHVGVISKRSDQWTFINSGRMDHNLAGGNQRQEVGEEDLLAEIRNWCRRAATRNEPLQVTVGRLDGMKLVAFSRAASRQKNPVL